jgi:hypothetical protein
MFREFGKIPRLYRDIIITEKIDGTNACVIVPDVSTDPVLAQSRTRLITPSNDNYGFAAWVARNAEFLRETLGPGHHFGEWWGSGIQKVYNKALAEAGRGGEKYFSLFNTARWKPEVTPAPLRVVPMLYEGPFKHEAVEAALDCLRLTGSHACPGAPAEGIVVFHVASGHLYKVTLTGDEAPKGLRK